MQGFKLTSQIIIWTVLALATFSCALGVAKQSSSNGPAIWVAQSLERIAQSQNPGSSSSVKLYAARGEYESFQIGIKSLQGGLTNVNVSVSDLSGLNNQVIPKSNITLYREHYVRVVNSSPKENRSSNPPLQPGWYADGLIPFVNPETKAELSGAKLDAVPFKLDAGSNQPIWVDVFVPNNAKPGLYKGTFTVGSNQGNFTGEISLKVWNFELPLKPSLKSSFLVWEARSKSTFVELLKHKIMPVGNINPADERELIDKWGLSSVRLPFWSGANNRTCRMNLAPSVEEIKASAAKHQSDLFLYVYSVDEIDNCQNLNQAIKQWLRNVKQAGVANLVVMTPVSELYDHNFFAGSPGVDVWVVSPPMYYQAGSSVSDVLKNKGKVWFYTALVPDDYSPKWQVDFEPINFRIPHGFINQSLGLTGALYWRVDFWTDDPWNNVETLFQDGNHYPGEGMLVYPGQQVGIEGVVPSMRLKWLRDGVEDYEYIQILKELGRGDWALEVSRKVGRDWKDWTRDPQALELARRQMGEEIERISTQ
ncbi:hypothetical protein Cylst_4187 [Cylindrospermum stagnale PCC 7417]|uniref:Uncharacterized protein n=1 Tax=Cylindrospermum stagnale PCC 7417 TaxID=56107 RepID=K9X1C8_9NOST|nr:DUF4091 domain-containing protein [Cylindrospermum stagnale]AFZ26288.1 hypothetical protein Cylst_4187 [Cylindrospermum stagnale PCC 7417]